ncbi:MarR family transcriptional regulator [Ralstonia solanacearum]|nr:MarR family transcriptional regulator [Ralstonia solanacearum]
MRTSRRLGAALKDALVYLAATGAALVVHAYALHLDEEAQRDVRASIAERQA